MTFSSVFRSVFCSLVICCLCGTSSVLASEATISSSRIGLPVLDEFLLLTPESPGKHPVASLLVKDCNNNQCAVYAGNTVVGDGSVKAWNTLPPFFQLQIVDDEFVVESDQFKALMQAMKADIDGLRDNVAASIAAAPFDINVLLPEGTELVFVDAPIEISDDIYESDKYLAIPANGSNNYRRTDGSTVNYSFDATFGFIHVRDKILLIIMFGPDKDAVWGRHTFEEFVRKLVQANR